MNPNEYFVYTAFLAAGMLIGMVIAWFAARLSFSSRETKFLAEFEVQTAENRTLRTDLHELKCRMRDVWSESSELKQDYAVAQSRLEQMAELKCDLQGSRDENAQLFQTITDLEKRQVRLETGIEQERLAADEKITLLQNLRKNMTETCQALSAGALRDNSRAFFDMAQTAFAQYIESAKTDFDSRNQTVRDIVKPVQEVLDKYDHQMRAMEREREKAYGGLYQQMQSLTEGQTALQNETGKLVRALHNPHTRGRWGEITLKRVAELAGMVNHCDFYEQPTAGATGSQKRPDMVVHLPGGRQIVVDAKTPLSAYLEAQECVNNREREAKLAAHANMVKAHIRQLAQKKYWQQFEPTPEFVILFIPGENFFSAALSQNPQLIENGTAQGVILATPTTLISLLKTIALVWRQETMAANAKAIAALGCTLYERLGLMAKNMNALGDDLNRCVMSHNRMTGSFERRVLVSARKFKELGASLKNNRELPNMAPVTSQSRQVDCKDTDRR